MTKDSNESRNGNKRIDTVSSETKNMTCFRFEIESIIIIN